MIVLLLAIGFSLFSILFFVEGVKIALVDPFQLLIAVLYLFSANMLYALANIVSGSFSINPDSLVGDVLKSKIVSRIVIVCLWTLALGNFVYSQSISGGIKGSKFILPGILSLLAYLILIKTLKNKRAN